jgi:hypothetical protein
VAGCALVAAPWLLRKRLGRLPAIVLAFGLAIDPGLVAMSHLAGGPMLAITFLVLTGLMWLEGRGAAVGLFAGLALLSGPSIWFGLLGLVLAWALSTVIKKTLPSPAVGKVDDGQDFSGSEAIQKINIRKALAWGSGTLLILGSLFILSPQGLSAFVMSFVESLRGWWTLSDVSLWRLLLSLPAYEIFPLGFGIAGAVRGIIKRERLSIHLSLWALAALLLAFLYPGKQTGDLTWALLPLWALAGLELGRHFDFKGRNPWELGGVFTLVVTLAVFGWLDLAGVTSMDLASEQARMRLYLLIAVFVLIGLSLLLAGAGWSPAIARLGGVWGGAVVLGLFTLAMSTGAAGLREPLTAELWQPEPRTGRVDVLLKVANQISDLNRGYTNQLPLTILAIDSPALHWLFRDWQVQDVIALAPDSNPELVISSIGELNLAADYRGEALPLNEVPDWGHATPSTWLKWFTYRQMPILREEVILWVRSDLMLDSQGLPNP